MFGLEPGWLWAIAGLLLLAAELLAPGFFLFFIGVAALFTGFATLAFALNTPFQVGLFVIAAAVATLLGRRAYTVPTDADFDPLLNDRANRLIGRTVEVVEPVSAHSGRVRVGDGAWNARGKTAAIGSTVRVTGVDGNCLLVEPLPEIESKTSQA